MRRTLALGTVAAALAAMALIRGAPAAAAIDLTGEWTFEISGNFGILGERTFVCATPLVQTGDAVSGDFDCGLASGSAAATLTAQGAAIDAVVEIGIPGFPKVNADAAGSVAPDGNSMEGTWADRDSAAEGTFLAVRNVPKYLKGDVNCDGAVNSVDALTELLHVAGAEVSQWPNCPGVADQFASLFGDMNCDDQVGSVDGLSILRFAGGLQQSPSGGCAAVGAMISAAP